MKKVNKSRVNKNIKESEVKKIIISATQILDLKDNSGNISAGSSKSFKNPNILSNQRNAEQLITSFLTKTGFEFEKFDMIRQQNLTLLKQAAEKEKAGAITNSTFIKDNLIENIANWRNILENIGTKIGPANPNFNFVVIGTPFLVWPSHGVIMDDPHIEPWKNSVKFKMNSNSSSNGYETLTFYFLWENPDNKYVVMNVESSLGLNGYCQNSADGGWAGIFPGGTSTLNLDTKLIIYNWDTQPPTSPFPESTQNKHILTLTAYGGGYFSSVGAIEFINVQGNFDLRYNLFLVPPHGVAVFEVALNISYQNDNSQIDIIDFESGDFDVLCPAVVLAILS